LRQDRGAEAVSNRRIMSVTRQLLSALVHLHSMTPAVIHRDIKPENVLVDQYGTVKLVDFGLARVVEPEDLASTYCGSPLYMSPEIFRGEEYNEKTDIWSLGCLLYELVSGRHPFKSSSFADLTNQLRIGTYRPLNAREHGPLVPLIHAMLKPRPEDRPTADALLASPIFRPNKAPTLSLSESLSSSLSDLMTRGDIAGMAKDLLAERREIESQMATLQRHLSAVQAHIDSVAVAAGEGSEVAELIRSDDRDTNRVSPFAGGATNTPLPIKAAPSFTQREAQPSRPRNWEREGERFSPLRAEADSSTTGSCDPPSVHSSTSDAPPCFLCPQPREERERLKKAGRQGRPSQGVKEAVNNRVYGKCGVLNLSDLTLTAADMYYLIDNTTRMGIVVTLRLGKLASDDILPLMYEFMKALPYPDALRKIDSGVMFTGV
ncbi:hypothetical protein KIPB_011635, partial [Kipferlia bialata]